MSVTKLIEKAGILALGGYKPNIVSTVATKNTLQLTEQELMTDSGNAQRFVHQHGSKVYFSNAENAWYIWSGKAWTIDNHEQVEILAVNTARNIVKELPLVDDAKLSADLAKFAKASMNYARITKMLKMAKPYLPITPEKFDTNPWLFNVDNGTIDLKTGELRPHNKDDLITKICNVRYVPEAKSTLWDEFLFRIFDGNLELIRFVQKMVGYCLTGDIGEKCFFILLGENGDNGKTVFVNVLMNVLADFATQTPIDTLLQRKPGAQSNDLVRLRGARLISSAEANKEHYFDQALVKRLTGSDPITARLLYKEHVTFCIEGKIVIATNRVPRFDKKDTAFGNRVRMIPFDVTIPPEEQDKNLIDKLKEQSEGILAWAVEGCLLWQREGLGDIPVKLEAEVEIRSNNSVEAFVESCCITGENFQAMVSDLHDAYKIYHAECGYTTEPLAVNSFGSELSKLGILGDHGRTGNFRIGIALKPPGFADSVEASKPEIQICS